MRTTWLAVALALALAAGCGAAPSAGGPPPPTAAARAAAAAAPSDAAALDALLDRAWADKKLQPSPSVDHATYLRRVSLDLIGRVATEAEARAFLDDPSADKRARAVERLLASAEHDAHLARTWERILLGPEVRSPVVDRGALRRWLEARFRENAPWDVVARGLIDAEGRSSLGGDLGPATWAEDPERGAEELREGINGATNYPLRFAKSPADLGGHVARTFLGVQIQCAQCHDHKTEAWKQHDYRAFSSALLRLRVDVEERDKGMLRVVTLEDAQRPPRRMLRDEAVAAIADTPPRTLDGKELAGPEPRAGMAAWITADDNPWFRRAAVNRVWGELFGEGLVHPVDDLRPGNPPVMPEVLDALEEVFARSGDDLDAVYRVLCATKAYALSVAPGEGSPRDQLFARAALRPISSDALVDSIFAATAIDEVLKERSPDRAAVLEARLRRRLGFVFESDAESNGADYQGTLQQSLFTMNGVLSTAATTFVPDGALAAVVRGRTDEQAIESLWLRVLGRRPEAAELERALVFVRDGSHEDGGDPTGRGKQAGLGRALRSRARDDRERAYEDLLWTLLNASELAFRR